jgi:hypothetical protein
MKKIDHLKKGMLHLFGERRKGQFHTGIVKLGEKRVPTLNGFNQAGFFIFTQLKALA